MDSRETAKMFPFKSVVPLKPQSWQMFNISAKL